MASAAVQNKTPRKVGVNRLAIPRSRILHCAKLHWLRVFTLVPMVFAIALAFCAWDGRHAIEFIGSSMNFVKLFTTDKIFRRKLRYDQRASLARCR